MQFCTIQKLRHRSLFACRTVLLFTAGCGDRLEDTVLHTGDIRHVEDDQELMEQPRHDPKRPIHLQVKPRGSRGCLHDLLGLGTTACNIKNIAGLLLRS